MSRKIESGTPWWVAVVYTCALVCVFLGERVLSTIDGVRWALTGLGLLAVLITTMLRWATMRATHGERRSVERALAILSTLGLLALLVYMTTAEPFDAQFGITKLATETRQRYQSAATVLWIALIIGSTLPMLFAERALHPMRRAPNVEWRRVRDAMFGGFTLSLCLVYGALFTFVADAIDVKADFSYFHTARPSESTRKIAGSAPETLKVTAFSPQPNEVGNEVSSYLRDLAKDLPKVDVRVHDRLLVPQLAKETKAESDGVVIFEHGALRESISVGTEIQAARPKLKTLDADVQKALLKVLKEKRTAYFTVGHGELNDAQPTPQNEGRTGKVVRELLEQQNYAIRDLNAATGLGVDVPDDAKLVVVVGPQNPFSVEEVSTLQRYAEHGGRLILALDPDAKIDHAPLADIMGLTISRSVLANDKVHMRRRFNDSDRTILASNRFSSHASVSTLNRMASRPVFFLGAASLDKKTGADSALKIDFPVRAMPDTFNDDNGNFNFDAPNEKRNTYALVAAVSKTVSSPSDGGKKRSDEMRAFVIGDADAASDAALGSDGNALLLADAVHWLTGEESFAGALTTAEDVRIEHTKQKDMLWFYGTIFGAPAVVLGGGLLFTRTTRRPKKKAKTEGENKPGTEQAS